MARTKTVRSVVRADKKKKTAGSGDGGEPSSSHIATIHKPAKCEKKSKKVKVWIDARGNIQRDVLRD